MWAGIHIIRRKVDIASSILNLVSIHLIRTKNPKQVIWSYLDRKIVIRLRRPQVLLKILFVVRTPFATNIIEKLGF